MEFVCFVLASQRRRVGTCDETTMVDLEPLHIPNDERSPHPDLLACSDTKTIVSVRATDVLTKCLAVTISCIARRR